MSDTRTLIEEMLEGSAFASGLGIELDDVGESHVVCSVKLREDHLSSYGIPHGGVAYSLADTTGAAALVAALGENRSAATIEGKLNYLSPADPETTERLVARADVVHLGSSTAVVEVEVRDGEKILNKGLFTFTVREE